MSDTATIITAIITTGLALAGLVLYLFRWLRQDVIVLRQEVRTYIAALNSRMEAMEARLNSRIDAVNARIGSLISLFPRPGSAA